MIQKTKLQRFYEFLERSIPYSLFTFLVIATNFCFLKIKINNEFISVAVTMFSIVYGFMVSSVCNLFGRKITNKLKNTSLDNKKSELAVFTGSIEVFIYRGVVFLLVSLLLFTINMVVSDPVTLEIAVFKAFIYVSGGYFISQVLFITISMYYYFKLLIVMLLNESALKATSNE